jgi:hypothetical protein
MYATAAAYYQYHYLPEAKAIKKGLCRNKSA